MVCMQSVNMFSICTDANLYTKNATTIDITIRNHYAGRMRYEVYLQFYDGLSWITAGYTSGSLMNYVVKQYALEGLRQGSYRLYGEIKYDDYGGTVGKYYTDSFSVQR